MTTQPSPIIDDSWAQVSVYSAAQLWLSTPSHLIFIWKYHVEWPQLPPVHSSYARQEVWRTKKLFVPVIFSSEWGRRKKNKKQWQLITIKGMSLLHLAPDLSLALRRFRPATPSLERDTNERIGTKHLTKCSWMPSAPQPYLSSLWSLIPWNHHLCIRVSR